MFADVCSGLFCRFFHELPEMQRWRSASPYILEFISYTDLLDELRLGQTNDDR